MVESRLPRVAWPKVRLDAVSEIRTGVAKGGKKPTCSVEVPYLRVANVQAGALDLSKVKHIEIDRANLDRYSLRPGDVLMTEGGDFDKLGRGTIWRGEIEPCVHQNHVFVVRCDTTLVLPEWVSWMAGSLYGRRYFLLCSKQSTNLASINSSQLRAFPLPLPTLAQQHTIAETMHALDRQGRHTTRLRNAKVMFKRGLVQQLLAGTKRFPQFANSKWKTVPLGDALTYVPRKVPKPVGTFLSAGVRSHGKGIFLKEAFPSDGIALEELFVLTHLDLVVNITFGWEGAIAIVPPEADGALVSHRFPSYEFDRTKALPEYFRHLIQSKRFVFDVACASPGGAGRNRVLNRRDFLEITVKLPSVEEQDRIANLMNGIDREIHLLERLHQQIEIEKRALLSRVLSGEISVPA